MPQGAVDLTVERAADRADAQKSTAAAPEAPRARTDADRHAEQSRRARADAEARAPARLGAPGQEG